MVACPVVLIMDASATYSDSVNSARTASGTHLIAKLAAGQSGQAALPPDRQVCGQGYVRTREI